MKNHRALEKKQVHTILVLTTTFFAAGITSPVTGQTETYDPEARLAELGVDDAAISIGQLGKEQHALNLANYLGRSDIKVLLPGFDEFLRRSDIPEKAKLEILNRLFELAGPDVRRFAVAYRASFPPGTKEEKNELYKKASQMVRQIQED